MKYKADLSWNNVISRHPNTIFTKKHNLVINNLDSKGMVDHYLVVMKTIHLYIASNPMPTHSGRSYNSMRTHMDTKTIANK